MPELDVKQPDQKVEDKKPDIKVEDNDGLSPEELTSARSLYKALKDPDTAVEIIESLAKRAGILDKKGEPKGTEKQTEKALGRITKKLGEKLGKDFEKFSSTVGPILDEAIDELMEERFNKSEHSRSAETWNESVDKFMESHELTPKVEKMMQKLMDEAPPNRRAADFKASKYLERMWKLAYQELDMDLPTKKSESRKKQVEDLDEIEEQEVDRKLTLDEAVDLAIKGIRVRRK